MFSASPIIINPTVLAAVVVAVVGFLVVWSNPQRGMNRAFCTGSFHAAVWLVCLHLALTADEGLVWLKLTSVIGGCLALHVWIIQQSITDRLGKSVSNWVKINWKWIFATIAIIILPYTSFFIPLESRPEHRLRGWGYYGFIVLNGALYVQLFRDALRSLKRLTGGKRLDLQLWLMGGCVTAVTILSLMGANGLTKDAIFIKIQPAVVLVFYAGTAYAITNHRIFDARQILLLGLEKSILVGAVAAVAFAVDWALVKFLPAPADFLTATALSLWFAVSFNGWLDRKFHFYPHAAVAREAAFNVAKNETRVDALEKGFNAVLRGWGQSAHSVILSSDGGAYRGGMMEFPTDQVPIKAMTQLRWSTPERLARERSTPERLQLLSFLETHSLGVVVISEGPSLIALIGVGTSASRRPFTYPQVVQLMELGSIIESALERAHVTMKAKHAEQLATVGLLGASVAHEIRNPLVSIKTFVQHLPTHYHDPAFRDKFFKLIGSEVSRIDQLTEQLLDLASPRAYIGQPIALHPIIEMTLELVSAKAADKNVLISVDLAAAPDIVVTDPSATKQVLLNLCFNALQAIDSHSGERWVKISTRNLSRTVEFSIEDSGAGISPEIRPKLFQPFQSTKSTGFGLGLAVCSNILASLNSSITVDPLDPKRGAIFRVIFPCPA